MSKANENNQRKLKLTCAECGLKHIELMLRGRLTAVIENQQSKWKRAFETHQILCWCTQHNLARNEKIKTNLLRFAKANHSPVFACEWVECMCVCESAVFVVRICGDTRGAGDYWQKKRKTTNNNQFTRSTVLRIRVRARATNGKKVRKFVIKIEYLLNPCAPSHTPQKIDLIFCFRANK